MEQLSYQLVSLPNGVRLAIEAVPNATSVAMGVWIGCGSHYEHPAEAGAAHLLEHMIFKSTQKRDAKALTQQMRLLGGEFNAHTETAATCYYAWTLEESWRQGFGIIAEMLLEGRIDPSELERERLVVLEEISGYESDTGERLMMEFQKSLWGDHTLGRPICGTVECVQAISRDTLFRLYGDLYTPDNVVLSIVGAVDPEEVKALAESLFGNWTGTKNRQLPGKGKGQAMIRILRDRSEKQAHLIVGAPGPEMGEPAGLARLALMMVLAGGPGSRLFELIRTDSGWAYDVSGGHEPDVLGGFSWVNTSVRPDRAADIVKLVRSELTSVANGTVSTEELFTTQVQIKSTLILELESIPARMHAMGHGLLLRNRHRPASMLLREINRVTPDDVTKAAKQWLDGPETVTVLGGVNSKKFIASLK